MGTDTNAQDKDPEDQMDEDCDQKDRPNDTNAQDKDPEDQMDDDCDQKDRPNKKARTEIDPGKADVNVDSEVQAVDADMNLSKLERMLVQVACQEASRRPALAGLSGGVCRLSWMKGGSEATYPGVSRGTATPQVR